VKNLQSSPLEFLTVIEGKTAVLKPKALQPCGLFASHVTKY
jgi:hypothetical protein